MSYYGETLYRKVGRRYERVSEFHTNPADGVWLVEKEGHSKRLITRLGELPDIVPLLKLEMHRDAVVEAVRTALAARRYSIQGVVDAVFVTLASREVLE